jgi:ABC-type multidrug transport system ATPase subunit
MSSNLLNFGGVRKKLGANNKTQQVPDLDETLLGNEQFNYGPKDPLIKVRKVVKKYGEFKAVDGISMDILTDRVTCILGHNGAGKTTLINCICGLNKPTEGNIFLKNVDVYSRETVLSGKVGYCTSRDVLYEDMTVSQFLNFVAVMKGVKRPHEHVLEVIKKCELQTYGAFLIKNLSGGTKRRTTIASAVIGEPKIIVMDEPSSGVDPENRRQLWKLIESLKDADTALILTTHHLEEAEYLSNDVIIINRG